MQTNKAKAVMWMQHVTCWPLLEEGSNGHPGLDWLFGCRKKCSFNELSIFGCISVLAPQTESPRLLQHTLKNKMLMSTTNIDITSELFGQTY